VKIAHLADLHLGFRQLARQTSQGINQREADIAGAFRRAVDHVIAAQPDLVIVAGDLFHSVRPTNTAILDSFSQFQRLRVALPQVPIAIVAGNHDTPRSVETGTILKLFEAVDGIHVVANDPQLLDFPELDLALLCIPNLAWSRAPRPKPAPDPKRRWNVLVTHREVEGTLPRDAWDLGSGGMPIKQSDLRSREFDYVALGHYHVPTRVDRNVWYAGSLEYVTTNPWGESKEQGAATTAGEKGWLLAELGKKLRVSFRPIGVARRVIDLEPIQGTGLTAAELDQKIAEQIAAVSGGIVDQIVRQVVYDIPRITARDLDHAAIRGFKATALHYRLDLRRPAPAREVGVGSPGRRQTLAEIVQEYLSRRPLPADVPRNRVVSLGSHYMEAVDRELRES
jgi:exonuclease SbcD